MPLVHALVLLDKESSGGRNVFGAPKTACGQPRWTPVTRETYQEYLTRRAECLTQGVGPLQLTFGPLQDRADAAGGCWDPRISTRVGLAEFARLLSRNTVRDAYSRWRYGDPEAEVDNPTYVDEAMDLLPRWQQVIDG